MVLLILDDFDQVITRAELEDVCGDLTALGLARLTTLENVAISEMTGYLDVRYDAVKCLDAAENDNIGILKQKLVDMILFHAFSSISPNNIPELRAERKDNAINYLEKVADGFIKPKFPVKEEDPTTPLRFGSSLPKNENYF